MKKTFKPMARTEKASHVYKKKTLNVTDDLNIKHDEDNLENVDEYWNAAASVLGNSTIANSTIDTIGDDTVIREESDTLFDLNTIRRSVKGRRAEEGAAAPRALSRGPAISSAPAGKLIAAKRLTLKPEERDSEEMVDMNELELKENANVYVQDPGRKAEITLEQSAGTRQENEQVCHESQQAEGSGPDFVDIGDAIFDPVDDHYLVSTEKSQVKHTKEKIVKAKQMARARVAPKTYSFAKRDAAAASQTIEVSDVKEVAAMNKIKPLVCTNEINTAIMELDHLAYIENESSDKAFSIFVIKGQVDVRTGTKKKVIRKGQATVIGEGTVYSLSCLSKNGASLFISYAL